MQNFFEEPFCKPCSHFIRKNTPNLNVKITVQPVWPWLESFQPPKANPSPEEKAGKELTPKTDIWDFGCLIEEAFEILEETVILEKPEKTLIKKMKAKKAKDRPSAEEVDTTLNQLWKQLIISFYF